MSSVVDDLAALVDDLANIIEDEGDMPPALNQRIMDVLGRYHAAIETEEAVDALED